jgi:hypothetical protein
LIKNEALVKILFLSLSITIFNYTLLSSQSSDRTNTSFILEYVEPNDELMGYADLISASGIFDEAINELETHFNLPKPIKVVFASGIEGPGYSNGVINMPYEFILHNDLVLNATKFSNSSDEISKTLLDLTEFVFYHQIGHALCDILDIPIMGTEEETVDDISAILSTICDFNEMTQSEANVSTAIAILNNGERISDPEFWKSHSLSNQRVDKIYCSLHDKPQGGISPFFIGPVLPSSKETKCQNEQSIVNRNWEQLFVDYLLD